MSDSPRVFDTRDADFEREVIAASRESPIVVDVWAPWCGPCRTLAPMLERLVHEHAGAIRLAKVNADENPTIGRTLGVRSIPAVYAFRDGARVAEFVGAQSEPIVRRFLEAILPTEADRLARAGGERLTAGDAPGAEASFRAALDRDARHATALVGLARLLAERGEIGAGLELLARVPPGPLLRDAEQLAAVWRTMRDAGGDEAALTARVQADPEDLEARFALGRLLAARGEPERALDAFLTIVRRDRSFADDGARRAMLDLFEVLGSDHPLVDRFRSELAKALFR